MKMIPFIITVLSHTALNTSLSIQSEKRELNSTIEISSVVTALYK